MAAILLVEDEPWLGDLYRSLLLRAGHEVSWCRDGYDAIRAIDQQSPDLIVLDLVLPWSNGLLLIHELASYPDVAGIPIVLCSAVQAQLSDEQCVAYGVSHVLDKTTMKPADLLAAVQEALHAVIPD